MQPSPHALGAPIFWGIVVPASIFILLVFSHDLWRRICPLAFLSQIPRALSIQRHTKRINQRTGKEKIETIKISKESWLGKNYLYLQGSLFFTGLCCRILFINSNRVFLGSFLLLTVAAAVAIGYLYGGKAWCQYFCPMAPVQKFYAEPRGLLGKPAHDNSLRKISQSTCRTINEEGTEVSACVACQTPCIDIDAERTYWQNIINPKQRWLYYCYFSLVVGYFTYYWLYSGSWDYYLSGIWAYEPNQVEKIFDPGFYIFGKAIPIPKIVAVPLTLGAFTAGGYYICRRIEKRYKAYQLDQGEFVSLELLRHQIFTICTFTTFNIFFAFAGHNFVRLFPEPIPSLFYTLVAIVSTLWLHRTWRRSSAAYSRESLAGRLRKQLHNIDLDTEPYLEGKSIDELDVDEVYVLAKVLPNFSEQKIAENYKAALKGVFEDGRFNLQDYENRFKYLRDVLGISNAEHDDIITELSIDIDERMAATNN